MTIFLKKDWMVAGGTISGNQSVASFEQILTNATQIDTGCVPNTIFSAEKNFDLI